jgi:hypothetical protein
MHARWRACRVASEHKRSFAFADVDVSKKIRSKSRIRTSLPVLQPERFTCTNTGMAGREVGAPIDDPLKGPAGVAIDSIQPRPTESSRKVRRSSKTLVHRTVY